MENYDQRRTISRAEIALEKSCMARYGLTYDPALGGSPPPQYDDANMARRYGVSDPDTAARYGYRLPDDVPPPTQPPMDAAETLVLTGALRPSAGHVPAPARFHGRPVPPGGCVGESVRRIEPAAAGSPDLSLPGRLDAESLDQAEAEPAVRDALKAWSSCMGRRGFVASTPFAATRIAGSDGTSGPGSRGVRVAVADVACKERTGLVKVWYAAEVAVQRRQIEENLPALRAVRDHIGAAVAAAAAVKG